MWHEGDINNTALKQFYYHHQKHEFENKISDSNFDITWGVAIIGVDWVLNSLL